MVFLCGYRSSGKSSIGTMLQKRDYWVFDVGPFLRDYHIKNDQNGLSFKEFIRSKEDQTNNPNWVSDTLQIEINRLYENGGKYKKDLIILGFRSLDDINAFIKKIQGAIFPEKEIKLVTIEVDLHRALKRYLQREPNNTEVDFWEQIDSEKKWGIDEVKLKSDVIIDNNNTLDELSENIGRYFK